jgi:lysine-specific histone demethylase 1
MSQLVNTAIDANDNHHSGIENSLTFAETVSPNFNASITNGRLNDLQHFIPDQSHGHYRQSPPVSLLGQGDGHDRNLRDSRKEQADLISANGLPMQFDADDGFPELDTHIALDVDLGDEDWYAQDVGTSNSPFLPNYNIASEVPQQPSSVLRDQMAVKMSEPIPTAQMTMEASMGYETRTGMVPEPLKNAFGITAEAVDADKSQVLSDTSEICTIPSSQASKATSPTDVEVPSTTSGRPSKRFLPDVPQTRYREDLRPKISIPTDLLPEDYARQCIVAAYSSRLNPYSLHPQEYALLRDHISHLQVTTYLNIRNGILRLWTRNPLILVTRAEAAGCAKDHRWIDVALLAHNWLIRNGYINFGCLELPEPKIDPKLGAAAIGGKRRKTIVVVGAGMSGLGCARQLEGLFAQYAERWQMNGEEPPKVIVLEGRKRIGGRIYSHELKIKGKPIPFRRTAEMGAQIVTGFEHGNPLNFIVRGQLALPYHGLKDNSVLYDLDGTLVNKVQDVRAEKLFNDILERASVYRHKPVPPKTVEGDKELIDFARDPSGDGGKSISIIEDAAASLPLQGSGAESTRGGDIGLIPAGMDNLAGKANPAFENPCRISAASTARSMGWRLRGNCRNGQNLNLDPAVRSSAQPTLGPIMDEALKQYGDLVELNSQDMRLMNWHYANLEYANAVNVKELSLSGWDQDIGNEFEGEHSEIIGGYLQVPRGIMQFPTKLDVRRGKIVQSIIYTADSDAEPGAKITCADGEVIEADMVVATIPLGVLKSGAVRFEPSLPDWKIGAIQRLGFGTLNKVLPPWHFCYSC